MDTQAHEVHRSPYKFNPRKYSPRHIMLKSSKIKGKERISENSKTRLTNMSVCMLRCVRFLAIPWTVSHQILLSLRLSSQEYWCGSPFLPRRSVNRPLYLLHSQPDSLSLSHHQIIINVSDFSAETLKTQRDWNATFKVQKNKNKTVNQEHLIQ